MTGPGRRTGDLCGARSALFLLPLLIAPSLGHSQQWSKPVRFENLPTVQVQWRAYGLDTKSGKNVFEWVFSNIGDTAVAFNYRIETDRRESRTGRISLAPGKKQLSGWMFSGDSLVAIDVDRNPFVKNK